MSIRPYLVTAVIAGSLVCGGSAFAGGGCPDDPERCVERGASMSRRSVAVPQASSATVAPARMSAPAVVAGGPAAQLTAHRAVMQQQHKSSNKPARVAPSTPAPATPGMGMLLKLSNGGGGDVSLFPSRPAENTGASWVL